MTAVAVLRELWSRRLLVAIGFALATMVALLMSFSVKLGLPPSFDGRQFTVGIGSAGVLVDSPSSQIADLGDSESKADVTSLSARAQLLGNLMATSPLKDQIARRAGVAPERMLALPPTVGPAVEPSLLDTGGTKLRASDREVNVLSIYVNELLPIITADAQAPTAAVAARISSAAVTELQLYLRSVAAADQVPDARQLVLEALGPARSATVQRGPRKLFSVIGFLAVFGLWCTAVVTAAGFRRGWKAAAAADRQGDAPAPGDQPRVPGLASGGPGSGRRAAPAPRQPQPDSAAGLLEPPERPKRPRRVA